MQYESTSNLCRKYRERNIPDSRNIARKDLYSNIEKINSRILKQSQKQPNARST